MTKQISENVGGSNDYSYLTISTNYFTMPFTFYPELPFAYINNDDLIYLFTSSQLHESFDPSDILNELPLASLSND